MASMLISALVLLAVKMKTSFFLSRLCILLLFSVSLKLHFRFSAVKQGANYDGSFWFMVDNVKVAFSDGHSPNSGVHPDSSATINLYLTASQRVQVVNHFSTNVFGTDMHDTYFYSWFTGFLLYAD